MLRRHLILTTIVLLITDCITGCKPTVPKDGLVAWWQAEGNASDSVGQHNGTMLNGASYERGITGQGFHFDGVNGEVSLQHTAAIDFGHTDSFTVDAWLNPSATVFGTQRMAVSLTYVCSPEGITMWVLTDGRIAFEIRDNHNKVIDLASKNSILGKWHHVAGVRDVKDNTVKLYVDGTLVDSGIDPTTGNFIRTNAEDRIGSIPTACPTSRYFWKGEIDEVKVYRRALSLAEIETLYKAGRPAWWCLWCS